MRRLKSKNDINWKEKAVDFLSALVSGIIAGIIAGVVIFYMLSNNHSLDPTQSKKPLDEGRPLIEIKLSLTEKNQINVYNIQFNRKEIHFLDNKR